MELAGFEDLVAGGGDEGGTIDAVEFVGSEGAGVEVVVGGGDEDTVWDAIEAGGGIAAGSGDTFGAGVLVAGA